MKTPKNGLFLEITLICFGVVISLISFIFGHDVWGGVSALAILVIVAIYRANLNLIHPLTWFPSIFFLYSIAYPVLVELGEYPPTNFLKETLFLEWIALLTFILVFGKPKNRIVCYDDQSITNIKIIAFPLYIVSFALTAIYIFSVYSRGLTSKYAISLDQSFLKNLTLFFPIFILCFILLLSYNFIVKKEMPKMLIAFTIGYTIIALLVLGERDLVLKVLLCILFLTHILYKRISRRKLMIIGILGLYLVPFLGGFKNFAVKEAVVAEERKSLVVDILTSEFSAASKNISELLNQPNLWEPFYGKTFLWDLQVVLGIGVSPGAWYNNTFFPELIARGGGNGFTIVGEGYINFGTFGVILVFSFLAMILKFVYLKSSGNIIWLTIYIASLPIFIYMIRGDLATLLTQVSKQIILPLIIIFILKHILENSLKKIKRPKRFPIYKAELEHIENRTVRTLFEK
ncbi:O-antigen polymerase [Sporosarcina sp. P1]|uniref:O-antigen polymerase n=1 Tax=Sporosarcina sp. P1 TaxID=2048257 RepID=UPI0013046B3C|nr:O-antigen polymerase [Sporosarcina sp. P1]